MFASGTYTPTYSGPITASGDLLRRLRNSGMAKAEFSGNERAFRPMKVGIGAGSGMTRFQGGITGDNERAKGFAAAQKAFGDYEQNLADARLAYQTGAAEEMAGIRGLRTQQRRIDQNADLDLRKIGIDTALNEYRRQQENRASVLANRSGIGGLLAGLF